MIGSEAALLAATATRTGVVLVAVVAGGRMFGKREIGELNVLDLMLVLVIANALQGAMTRNSGQLAVAVVAGGTLVLLGRAGAWLVVRQPRLETRLMGAPSILVHEGKLVPKNMQREHIDEQELMEAVREQGLAEIGDVELAVLEMDGVISVVPKQAQQRQQEGS